MLAGRLASDSVPPRLTASLMICNVFKNLKAAAWPPTMSNENVEPAPVHCLANTRPAGEAFLRGEQGSGLSRLWRGRAGSPRRTSRVSASAFSICGCSVFLSDRLIIQQEWGSSWVPMAPRNALTPFMRAFEPSAAPAIRSENDRRYIWSASTTKDQRRSSIRPLKHRPEQRIVARATMGVCP